jgi:hypothetical protein
MRFPLAVVLAAMSLGTSGEAQTIDGAVPGEANPFGMKLLALTAGKPFSANAVVSFVSRNQPMEVKFPIASRGGSSRVTIELATLPFYRPEQREQVKSQGMSSVTIIAVPEKRIAYVTYPDIKAYYEQPIDASAALGELQAAGKETIGGRSLDKKKVMVGGGRTAEEWSVWYADGFPVRVERNASSPVTGIRTQTLELKDLSLTQPAAALFEVPAGYKRFKDLAAFSLWVIDKVPPPQ